MFQVEEALSPRCCRSPSQNHVLHTMSYYHNCMGTRPTTLKPSLESACLCLPSCPPFTYQSHVYPSHRSVILDHDLAQRF